MNRTIDTFTCKPPNRDEVEVQVSIVDGTPLVWAKESGRPPTVIRGVRALTKLQDAIGRALECTRPIERQAHPDQLSLVETE